VTKAKKKEKKRKKKSLAKKFNWEKCECKSRHIFEEKE
jgi:hypothetical protein